MVVIFMPRGQVLSVATSPLHNTETTGDEALLQPFSIQVVDTTSTWYLVYIFTEPSVR